MAAVADFSTKFGLVLKALNLSRGQVARIVGIDKSVVSRWASGVQAPTDHNLALLTEAIARLRPGFGRGDWDRDAAPFAASLDLGTAADAAPSGPPAAERPSIAVLPFANMSGDAEQDYFVDGLVEDITTALSRFKSLFVIARNSSFTYKGRAVDIKQVGRELGARYVLEGSVRKGGDRLRITGQLIDTGSGGHLWADRFDGALSDVFELQDGMTAKVVAAIAPRIGQAEIERARRKPLESLDAYDCHLQGMALANERTQQSIAAALRLAYRAIERDADFAAPYALAAHCYLIRKNDAWMDDEDRERTETRRLALQVQRLGRDDGLAQALAGRALSFVCRDYDIAHAMVEQAVAANPNLAEAWLCRGTVSVHRGEYAAGIEYLQHVLRMSPQDPSRHLFEAFIGWALLLQGQLAEAIRWAEASRRRRPDTGPALRVLAASHALSGNLTEAERAVAAMREYWPHLTLAHIRRIAPFRRTDDVDRALEGLRLAGMSD